MNISANVQAEMAENEVNVQAEMLENETGAVGEHVRLTDQQQELHISLLQVEKRSRNSARKLFAASQRARARLALASLCFSRLRVEFQAYYQVLETHNIPRSSDPRVPPRVVSLWTERGQVDGGSVTLKPNELPSVHKDGVTIRFVSDLNAAGKRPMLSNVVQRNRRIYTMVTVKLLRSNSAGENRGSATGDGLVLRSYSYLKEFGEWKTPTLPEKRMLAAASVGSRHGRFDLGSQDGSVILELEVPTAFPLAAADSIAP
ncbi:hypothetical protein PR003_g27628 [Phytophthora rubi]|uniref:Uncharacterized protein n=1 Tax=Phytophthora rubi TaxID=129364 RepID=A0A6A4C0R3_9STRA|nr:hypothetical protein PR003_g27628 [Phytophthora rubi]